ncbi:MAG TPA: hypothetical protein DCF68_16575 [Cyanothece sp. UBA12306]|nr:hypothetical protein [Cyanothece sp. UBA12306]
MESTLIAPSNNFKKINAEIGFGFPKVFPNNWQGISQYPLLILVGLTGVGKTTVTKKLLNSEFNFTLLPNRRTLADKVIFPTFTQNEETIFCRIQRLEYTRKYQQLYSGGMAYVLSQLKVKTKLDKPILIFDGLRGKNEVIHAAKFLPNAQFLILEASNNIRLQRLINRKDKFDYINTSAQESLSDLNNKPVLESFSDLNIPQVSQLLTTTEQQEWLSIINQGKIEINVLKDKLKIILKEQQNYDIKETRNALLNIVPQRTLAVDTACYNCQQISEMVIRNKQISQWLETKYYNCS